MHMDGSLKMQSRPDLGFYYFLDMPLYSSTNELRKACLYQSKELDKTRGKLSDESWELLRKKLMKSTAILSDHSKRERYLNFLRVRAYINQVSNLTQIQSFQYSRVFPWMIFKIKSSKGSQVLEVDLLKGFIKVTSCEDHKVSLQIRSQEINGCYDMFDTDSITLSYIAADGTMEYTFDPFYPSHKQTILQYVELFVEFDRLYLLNRREISWQKADEWTPKKNTSDLSMHDGLLLFNDDRIIPPLSGFKDVAELVGKNLKVKVAIGAKYIVIARDSPVADMGDIIDLYVITQKSPKITIQEGIVVINEESSPAINLRFDNTAKGPTLIKAIVDFQQANYSFQYECNIFPTIAMPSSFEGYVSEIVNFVQKKNQQQRGAEEEEELPPDDYSSDFEGYDYEY